uniref:EOG090X09QT n=1 Tax=Evadne anonyx TaxID=141404 RepID=A0A9N6ZE56_9CRUS|nr:EOG090X09QT [Evadne anonyx]
MAKWGEGDPRWIVEERPDATNVNNWHWTEKNASQWSKDRFQELLHGFVIENEIGKVVIDEIEKAEGEASANNRKAKLIFFYEWVLTLKWKGTLTGSTDGIEGTIIVPNLSDENTIDEVVVDVTVTTNTAATYSLKEMIRIRGAIKIKEQLAKYIKSLQEDFTQGMILPKKEAMKNASNATKKPAEAGVKLPVSNSNLDVKKLSITTKFDTKTYEYLESFKCPPAELYNVLTLPELLRAFTNSPVESNVKVGGKFSLFGGQICGEFVELVTSSNSTFSPSAADHTKSIYY